ncbi:MAG TPA: M28 family peptidase [Ktedonobacterales bacterium]
MDEGENPVIRRRISQCSLFLLLTLALAALAPVATVAPVASAHAKTVSPSAAFPTVDPSYIYNQLYYMVTNFQRREAGYDNNLPVTVNGHDEFAAYWQSEMLRDLQGFGAQAQHDPLSINGWAGRKAITQAFNVEITIPGVTHPEQMVVIGCHYDGEASSTQSANDDASGCAIELGVAKALATYWSANHLYPARTLRFVAYDAEEQGIYGSFHYVNQTINGDLSNVVTMINEEQSGIGYPLRFLGKASYPLLPTTLQMTPITDNEAYRNTQALTATQVQTITDFKTLMQGAAPAAFSAFRALGYGSLNYRDGQNHPVTQQIFTPQDLQYAPLADDADGGSDNYPFALAGLPTATFIGNFSYYGQNPPPWSYPYDQPQDTIQLMNVYASGSTAEAKALDLALALPGMLTTWTLAQPAVLGFASTDGKPLATIGDVGSMQPGAPVSLNATAYDPANAGAAFTYTWNFGDGAQAQGATVQHTWASAGDYSLTLTASGASGARVITKTIHVTTTPPVITDPYAAYPPQNGVPPANHSVTLPQPDQTGGMTIGGTSVASTNVTDPSPWGQWVAIVVAALASLGLVAYGLTRRRRSASTRNATPTLADIDRLQRESAVRDLLTPRATDDQSGDEEM